MSSRPDTRRLWLWLFAAFLTACAVYLLAVGFSRGHLAISTLWPARWVLVAPLERTVNV